MNEHAQLCQDLQTLWHEHFPLTRSMEVQVASYTDHVLTTRTPLMPNTNIHNTAFAGSLYAIESLTAWGVLYLELQVAGFDASIIHASGTIKFDSTITTDIVACTDFSGNESIFEELRSTGKARLNLRTQVFSTDNLTEPAGEFSGLYVVRLNR